MLVRLLQCCMLAMAVMRPRIVRPQPNTPPTTLPPGPPPGGNLPIWPENPDYPGDAPPTAPPGFEGLWPPAEPHCPPSHGRFRDLLDRIREWSGDREIHVTRYQGLERPGDGGTPAA